MDPGIHLAGAARQRDRYPNPHPFSAMDPGIHRGGQARRARWIRQSIAGTQLPQPSRSLVMESSNRWMPFAAPLHPPSVSMSMRLSNCARIRAWQAVRRA